MAGESEVLVDEIVYLAHKAAHPASYPLRQGAMRGNKRQQENAKKFTTPTNVHLQVYDGMPHVLTVFGYTESVRLLITVPSTSIANTSPCSHRRDVPIALSLNSLNMLPKIPPTLGISRSPNCIKRSPLRRARATRIRSLLESQGASRSRSQGLHGSARSPKTSPRRNVLWKKGTRILLYQRLVGVSHCHPMIMWAWLR